MEQFDIIYAHRKFEDQNLQFAKQYDLKNIFTAEDTNHSKRDVAKHIPRTCLFCGKIEENNNFDTHAHLVSKFIGNSRLYSHFECDECNWRFSDFEANLSDYLGIARTLHSFNVRKRTPGFVGRKLRAKSRSFIGEDILVIAPEDYQREGNRITINSVKNAYVPCKVYKALLKSALSLLGPDEVKANYPVALNYLNGKFEVNTGAFMAGYKFRVQFPFHAYLFEKKNKTDKIPTHIIAFYFMENNFTIPIPFHKEDMTFITNGDNFALPPPFFINQDDCKASMPEPFAVDFSSAVPVKNEQETFTLVLNADELKNNTWYYNPAKDEKVKADFNPGPTKFLILTRDGFVVDPKEFSMFMRKMEEDF